MMRNAQLVMALFGCLSTVTAYAEPIRAVAELELDRYLGVWYEIARKPFSGQKTCTHAAKTIYTLNENGQILIQQQCLTKQGREYQQAAEGFIANQPFNSKFKVSYLPEAVRWIPVLRGDYWILKIDEDYQTVLVGEPKRQYLWLLAREPALEPRLIKHYLNYAKSLGYDLDDLIYSPARDAQLKH